MHELWIQQGHVLHIDPADTELSQKIEKQKFYVLYFTIKL